MENETLFTERQKFKQWWLWIPLLATNALFIFIVIFQVVFGQQFGTTTGSNTEILKYTGLLFLITGLIFIIRLDTTIKKDGIYVRFFPFHLTFRHYTWDKISKSFVRKYSTISEYGGWGFRFGIFGKGKAFNISGDKGMQLEFTNNKKLLIGTNKPYELTEALKKIGQLKQ